MQIIYKELNDKNIRFCIYFVSRSFYCKTFIYYFLFFIWFNLILSWTNHHISLKIRFIRRVSTKGKKKSDLLFQIRQNPCTYSVNKENENKQKHLRTRHNSASLPRSSLRHIGSGYWSRECRAHSDARRNMLQNLFNNVSPRADPNKLLGVFVLAGKEQSYRR